MIAQCPDCQRKLRIKPRAGTKPGAKGRYHLRLRHTTPVRDAEAADHVHGRIDASTSAGILQRCKAMTDPQVLALLTNEIGAHCADVADMFKPGMKVTILARRPEVPDGSQDVVVTDDSIDEAIEALKLLKLRPRIETEEGDVVVEQRGPPPASAAYHAHLDECAQCRDHPLALCATGAKLLEAAACP